MPNTKPCPALRPGLLAFGPSALKTIAFNSNNLILEIIKRQDKYVVPIQADGRDEVAEKNPRLS
jgi:hypothetical protein